MNRLPNLPFLPAAPPGPRQAYDKTLNVAIAGAYQTLARSIDGMILTGGTSLPGASGLRRLYYNGTTLYIDTTTSWTPVAIGNSDALSAKSTVLPSGGYPHGITAGAGPGNMVPIIQPIGPHLLNISSVDLLFSSGQASAVGSSQARSLNIHAAIYSAAGTNFVKVSNTSTNLVWTVTGATFVGTGIKRGVLPWALTLPAGPEYHLAVMTSTASSGNALAATHSQILAQAAMAWTFFGDVTNSGTTVSSHQMVYGFGLASASTTAFPTSLAVSDMSHTVNIAFPVAVMRNAATV